jgi:hypothetical protein
MLALEAGDLAIATSSIGRAAPVGILRGQAARRQRPCHQGEHDEPGIVQPDSDAGHPSQWHASFERFASTCRQPGPFSPRELQPGLCQDAGQVCHPQDYVIGGVRCTQCGERHDREFLDQRPGRRRGRQETICRPAGVVVPGIDLPCGTARSRPRGGRSAQYVTLASHAK